MSLIYYFIFISLAIPSYFEFSNNKKFSRQWYIFVVIVMMLTAGLGYGLSPDWIAYRNTFELLFDTNWLELGFFGELAGMESGYLALNKFIGLLGFDFGMVYLVMATTSLFLKASTFYKYGGLPFLVLFMYSMPNFMFEEHVHIRQGLANAIAIFSIRYIIDKKLIKFLICIVLGYQFHESIIVFLLAYWIAHFKFNTITIGWLVTIAIVGNYTGINSIIEIIMKYMPFGADKFEDYQSQLYAESGVAIGDIVKILSVICIMLYNGYGTHDKLYCMFRNLFIFGVLLYFFLGKGIFGIRLPGYYLVFLGLTLGRLLYSFNGEELKRRFIYLNFIAYTSLLIYWFQVKQGHQSNFNNYRTIFNKSSSYGLWKD